MFTWICPKCGSEVPTYVSDCPKCSGTAETAGAQASEAGPASPPPPAHLVAVADSPAPRRRGHAPWFVTPLVAIALIGLGGGLYWYTSHRKAASAAPATPAVGFESPAAKSVAPASADPETARVLKYLEVTGIRVIEEGKRPLVRLLVVNHSAADLAVLSGTITLKAVGKETEVASLKFSLPSLRPYEAREISSPLKTSLRAYEMPDWQFLRGEVRLDR